MKTLSIHVHPKDWQVFQEKCRNSVFNQSQLIRILADEALRVKARPRSNVRTPGHKLQFVGFTVPNEQEKRWRRECGMSLRLWLCECVLPLVHSDISRLLESKALPEVVIEYDEGLLPCHLGYSDKVGFRLSITKQQYAKWIAAAEGQGQTIEEWIVAVADQAAPWFIQNPKGGLTQ